MVLKGKYDIKGAGVVSDEDKEAETDRKLFN